MEQHTETFHSLPKDKQNAVIDAALAAFGQNGYKKASVADIANAAGISKAMIFYYFGCKKGLYRYLFNFSAKTLTGEMSANIDSSVTDYFDRIKMMSEIKIQVLKKHPPLYSFLTSAFSEADNEVLDICSEFREKSGDYVGDVLTSTADFAKFKDDIDANLIFKLLLWAAEGFSNQLINKSEAGNFEALDPFIQDFYKCLDMMKKHFYKPEYV